MAEGVPTRPGLFAAALADSGLTVRQAARVTGTSQSVIRSVCDNDILHPAFTIRSLMRLCEAVGLQPGDLLDPAPPVADADEATLDDARRLGRVLQSDTRTHPVARLCAALQWDAPRTLDALKELDALLRPAGLRIHSNAIGCTIRPNTVGDNPDAAALSRVRDADAGLNNNTAAVLYAAYLGTLSTRGLGNDERVQVAKLRKDGALDVSTLPNAAPTLTKACGFSFDVD